MSDSLIRSSAVRFPYSMVIGIACYVGIAAVGLAIRIAKMRQFVGHIDEPASLLAIQRVAESGLPMFPSGVLYLQGAVFSYLAAPLAWVFSETGLWRASIVLHLILSLTIIPLSMKLVSYISGNLWAALFVGFLVASDPNLIHWSVAIRPYGILAVAVVAFVLLFSMLLRGGPNARIPGLGKVVYWIPLIVTLGTFTHIGFWLSVPPLILVGVLVWGRNLFGSHRSILISGIVSFVPLVAFFLMGRYIGTGAGTGDGGITDSFVGSHLFSASGVLTSPNLDWRIWTGNFSVGMLPELVPVLIAFASGVLILEALFGGEDRRDQWRAQSMAAIVLVHWTTIWAVTLFVFTDSNARYLHQILSLGYVMIGLALWVLWRHAQSHRISSRWLLQAGIAFVFVLPFVYQAPSAADWSMNERGGSSDYWNASAWAAENRDSGQIVITALPPSAYFWFSGDELDQLMFLSGPADGQRTQRYIKPNKYGELGDYWLGVNSIGSVQQLCVALTHNAGNALIVADSGRLSAPWAFRGQFEEIIRGSAIPVYQGINGVMVLEVNRFDDWTPEANESCS